MWLVVPEMAVLVLTSGLPPGVQGREGVVRVGAEDVGAQGLWGRRCSGRAGGQIRAWHTPRRVGVGVGRGLGGCGWGPQAPARRAVDDCLGAAPAAPGWSPAPLHVLFRVSPPGASQCRSTKVCF